MKVIGVTDDQQSVEKLAITLQQTLPYLDAIILREKSKTAEQLTELVHVLRDVGTPLDKLIIHANPALAQFLSIQKVQLTGYGMSLADAQLRFPSLTFGCSVHSLEEALQAEASGASWILYGHVYPTSSKKGIRARGTDELRQIVSACMIPVYAIGGIQPEHMPSLEKLGVAGIAILSPISQVEAVKKYRRNGENCSGNDY
ncbi:thiazole tautomerase TenI [Sporosarcina sp. PTS2304]|uniref:thiamine phosphate synthase n=1 Tax=Sporosarcina sp. PTS2304 TaxID=2283194 RepID=UPI000E0D8542|nr:thiamine phosphate synthase [Sporosarcina sp. PTS2304]AXI00890.1 thiazole tautomerase TenI [Sporosarcina sp. PTS2304]